MNINKFIPKIGFALTLLVLSRTASGFTAVLQYILIGVLVIAGFILLLENRISSKRWKVAVEIAQNIDLTYVAFGLGLILSSVKIIDFVGEWAAIMMMVAGALFAGTGIGKLLGKSASEVVKSSPTLAIICGVFYVIIGIVYWVLTKDSISKSFVNATAPALIIAVGLLALSCRCSLS